MIKFLRGAPGIAAGKSGDAPGQEEPELLSTALPIEIFGNTDAPAPRPLSRTASRAGNGAKEPENQGFLRSPEPKLGSLEWFVASSHPERAPAEERVSACLSRASPWMAWRKHRRVRTPGRARPLPRRHSQGRPAGLRISDSATATAGDEAAPDLRAGKSCAVAKALALVGVSQTLIARCLGIAPSTLCLWKAQYPEFLNALKHGTWSGFAAFGAFPSIERRTAS